MTQYKKFNVCVIGAGIIGLSSAYNILNSFRDRCNLTIIADNFSPNLTSNVAAGIIDMHEKERDDKLEDLSRWTKATWMHCEKLINSKKEPRTAALMGIQLISGYYITSDINENFDFLNRQFSVFPIRLMDEKEMKVFFPDPRWKKGCFRTHYFINCNYYLKWLTDQLYDLGANFRKQHVSHFGQLSAEYDVVVNCCGLGAKELVKEETTNVNFQPVRGQTVRFNAPWIKHYVMSFDTKNNNDYHVFPLIDSVMCGGTFQHGNTNMENDDGDVNKILKECCRLVPTLKHGEIITKKVGLRPYRNKIRLELERNVHYNNQRRNNTTATNPKFIIHNYGHGGVGITLHWGCALQVKDIFTDHILPAFHNSLSKL